ncbi:Tex family protein [Thiomicrorhabdus aquaedulcis]|uniref:Tex family protein n=1 Tax=Thiomicrorhabdus aquaedulcis TaxID=2211106 RepID=UPI000FDBD56E|nr:Tex family protein [Thiomicrorhabdus aquaedulcis]
MPIQINSNVLSNVTNPLAYAERIAQELQVKPAQVSAAIGLLSQGATVPFIARYRKDITQGLDDIQLRELETRLTYLTALGARKLTVLESLQAQGLLTPERQTQLEQMHSKTELEDWYKPFKPVRNSKVSQAKDAGLEPLALALWNSVTHPHANLNHMAKPFVNPAKNIAHESDALNGAQAILIERLTNAPGLVNHLRETLWREGVLGSKALKNKANTPANTQASAFEFANDLSKFKDYLDFSQAIGKIPSHRALALFRGEQAGLLKLSLALPSDPASALRFWVEKIARFNHLKLSDKALKSQGELFLTQTIEQAWKTKLAKSLQTELFSRLREHAEQVAIEVFAQNLKALLLAAPAGNKITLALDPGFKSGVKLAIIDATGKFLHHDVLYPHAPQNQWNPSLLSLKRWVEQYQVQLISIGNGTASRETEQWVDELLVSLNHAEQVIPQKVVVSEAGASVYSASQIAQKEFPQLDVTIRGAVSIGRRLQDPLAELVKIDPKAIGVGQYQHDVNQGALAQALHNTVEDCVNLVGVDLNIASSALLGYVSGLSPRLADEIVHHRDQYGAFTSRQQLKKVPRLGPKAFEQCAGFLRIRGGVHPLDQSAVHPESYEVVENMAKRMQVSVHELMGQAELIKRIPLGDFVQETMGLVSLKDIVSELEKPGRDPRPSFKVVSFAANITKITDLTPGLSLDGVVTNVTPFGAFVDIGVHQDGLVHISQLANEFIKDPHALVKAGQIVTVRVLEVDAARKRISLTMKTQS